MNWDDIRFLLAIHRGRTLSAAARQLGVNQTTVARRLAALERDLGTRLFDRVDRDHVATSAGDVAASKPTMIDVARNGLLIPMRCMITPSLPRVVKELNIAYTQRKS